jgi:hypothetical protein
VSSHDETITFWFPKGRAGMPVQVEQRVGGGRISRSVVIADYEA